MCSTIRNFLGTEGVKSKCKLSLEDALTTITVPKMCMAQFNAHGPEPMLHGGSNEWGSTVAEICTKLRFMQEKRLNEFSAA